MKLIPRLDSIASEINESHDRICAYVNSTNDLAKKAIEEAVYCGGLLNKARDSSPHGTFIKWIADHCPNIAQRTAYKYMQLERMSHDINLIEAGSIKKAYILCGIISEPGEPSKSRSGNTDVGGVLTLEGVIGLNWVRWVKQNFEPRIDKAPLDLLYQWHEQMAAVVEKDRIVVEKIRAMGGKV